MLALILALVVLDAPLASPTPYPRDLAVIVNSGSTNAAGYTMAAHRGGKIDVMLADSPVAHPKIPAKLVARLYMDLARTGPLDALPVAHCMKSVSFGTRTSLQYDGATSPDLSCPGSDAARQLNADANAIVSAANINTHRRYVPFVRRPMSEHPPTSPITPVTAPVPLPSGT